MDATAPRYRASGTARGDAVPVYPASGLAAVDAPDARLPGTGASTTAVAVGVLGWGAWWTGDGNNSPPRRATQRNPSAPSSTHPACG